jgi:hypothetical protein
MKPDVIAFSGFTGGLAAQTGGLHSGNGRLSAICGGGERPGGQRLRNFRFCPAYFPLVNKLRGGSGKGMA